MTVFASCRETKSQFLEIPISYSIPTADDKEESLEKTLLDASLFNSGINEHKIHQQIFDLKITKDELNTLINKYLMPGKVIRDGSTISFNSNEKEFYKRKEKSMDKRKTDMLLCFLDCLPFVTSIAFSGGTANYG